MNKPMFETPIPTGGENGNVYVILAIATSYMRKLGLSKEEQQKLRDRVHASHDYKGACKIIKEWFPLKPDPTKVKPKFPKRGKNGRFVKYDEAEYEE